MRDQHLIIALNGDLLSSRCDDIENRFNLFLIFILNMYTQIRVYSETALILLKIKDPFSK